MRAKKTSSGASNSEGDEACPTALQEVLANNIRGLIRRHHEKSRTGAATRHASRTDAERRPSLNAWARAHNLDDKVLHRVLGPRSITVVTLEQIALSEKLEPWQLLVPKLDPDSPPPIIGEFSALAIDLARALDTIVDRELRERCYALVIRRIELETENSR